MKLPVYIVMKIVTHYDHHFAKMVGILIDTKVDKEVF